MNAVWYDQLGAAADVLQYGDLVTLQAGPGEVLVRLAVSGVNPVDVKRRQGGRGTMSAPRIVPHFDGAGVIDAVGDGVDAERVGQRVWIYGAQWQRDFGTAAELVAVSAEQAVPLPDAVTFDEGACLGIPALTAHGCVFSRGDVRGQTMLITGGAGAVGRYAVQMAKLGGARVIATVSSDKKAELAATAGADEVVNYRNEDVASRVNEITGGAGIDRIVEVEFGGNLETSLQVLKPRGTITTYASQAVPEPTLPFYDLLYRSVVIEHVLTFQVSEASTRQAIHNITEWLQKGALSHHVGPRFALRDAVAAHEAVERGALGKVLIDIHPAD